MSEAFNDPIETWQITLPDGTVIKDEIEWGHAMTVAGIQLIPMRNRRTISRPEEEDEFMPIPENWEENHADLKQLVIEWEEAERLFEFKTKKREEQYIIYRQWLSEHLGGTNMLSSMFMANAKKMPHIQKQQASGHEAFPSERSSTTGD